MQPLQNVQVSPDIIARARIERTYPFVPSALNQGIIDTLPKDRPVLVGEHPVDYSKLLAIHEAGNLSLVISDDNKNVEFLIPQDIHPDYATGNTNFRDAEDRTLERT